MRSSITFGVAVAVVTAVVVFLLGSGVALVIGAAVLFGALAGVLDYLEVFG